MHITQPIFAYADVREAVVQREAKKFLSHQTKDLHFFSANLSRFLPHLPLTEHQEYYLDFMSYRSLAVLQSEKPECLSGLITTGDLDQLASIKTRPVIFCTFHLGSYRSLLGYLIREGLDFALLVDQRTYARQYTAIHQSCDNIKTWYRSEMECHLVDAERTDALLTVLRHLEAGRSLVIYLDGNTGSGGIFSDNPLVYLDMSFMGHPFRSRKGVATLAWLTKRPIVPAISYYEGSATRTILSFGSPISPPASRDAADRDRFVDTTTRRLYGLLEERLRQYPLQWEPWLYVHKFLPLQPVHDNGNEGCRDSIPEEQASLFFNHDDFALFKIEQDCFLFSRSTYEPYPIDNEVFGILWKLSGRPVFETSECPLSRDSLGVLLKKRVFIQNNLHG